MDSTYYYLQVARSPAWWIWADEDVHSWFYWLGYFMFGFFRSHRNPVFFGGLSSSLNLPESLVLTAVPLEIPFGTLHACRVAPWILSDLRSCSEFPSLVAPRGCKEAYGMSISVEPAWVCMSLHTNIFNMGSRWFKLLDGGSACSNTCPGTGSKDRSNPLFSLVLIAHLAADVADVTWLIPAALCRCAVSCPWVFHVRRCFCAKIPWPTGIQSRLSQVHRKEQRANHRHWNCRSSRPLFVHMMNSSTSNIHIWNVW